MLDVDPGKRITLGQVLQHRWIVNRDSLPSYQLRLQNYSQLRVSQLRIFQLRFLKCIVKSKSCTNEHRYFDFIGS